MYITGIVYNFIMFIYSIVILNYFVVINHVVHLLCKNLLDFILKLYFSLFMQYHKV